MDITVTLQCNNDCRFCPRDGFLSLIAAKDVQECFRIIDDTRRQSDTIVLSGGEITLLPDITEIVKYCVNKKYKKIGIITNGRVLAEPGMAQQLIASGVNDIAVSLYSTNPKTHDYITRVKGSCNETITGIRNIRNLRGRYDIGVRVNIVLNLWNAKEIFSTISELHTMGITEYMVAEEVIIPKSRAHLSLRQVKQCMREVTRFSLGGAQLTLHGFSPCMFDGVTPAENNGYLIRESNLRIVLMPHQVDTLILHNRKKEQYLGKFKDLFIRIKQCSQCSFEDTCPGIQKEYFIR